MYPCGLQQRDANFGLLRLKLFHHLESFPIKQISDDKHDNTFIKNTRSNREHTIWSTIMCG